MLFFVAFYIIIGCSCGVLTKMNTEELAVDPMSIFVDPYLYRFCWRQFGLLKDKIIQGKIKESNSIVTFEVFQDDQYDKETFCISNRGRSNSFIITLPIIKSKYSSTTMNFSIRFYQPLGPPLELLQYRTVPNGIYFYLNTDFAGISKVVDPQCNILLTSKSKENQTFQLFQMKTLIETFKPILSDSEFSIYYSCIITQLFDSSTRFMKIKDTHKHDEKTEDLKPIIQMPFRRFLKMVWNHSEVFNKRYDIGVYEKSPDFKVTCIKVFRIFINILLNNTWSSNTYARGCGKDITMEDMGYAGVGGIGYIEVILDMVKSLKMYSKYKFSIFWKTASGKIKENYLYFTPLPNENSGNINNDFIEYQSLKYNEIMNKISSMNQQVLSKNNQNPYTSNDLNVAGYTNIVIQPGVMVGSGNSFQFSNKIEVSKLYKDYKSTEFSKNFNPYFYALLFMKFSPGVNVEIVQLPIPQDASFGIEQFQFKPNDKDSRFIVSWKIFGHPNVTAPAVFGIEVKFGENSSCHCVYILTCRTCNSIYVRDTIQSQTAMNKKNYWNINCILIQKLNGHFDAIDSSISFETVEMPSAKIFVAQIFSFKNDIINESKISVPRFITASVWQKYGNTIISVICATVGIIVLILLFLFCRKICGDPKIKEHEDSNTYENEDEM